MSVQKEVEIIQHTKMNSMELFLVEMMSRNPHGHDDLEIGMIMEGSVTLFLEQQSYKLQVGDLFIINRHQVHSLSSKGKNLILAAQIHTEFYRQIDYSLEYLRFENSILRTADIPAGLRNHFFDCAASYFSDEPFFALKSSGLMLQFLYELVRTTPCYIASEKESVSAYHNTMRLNRIINYISKHYTEHISLQDIADLEHVTDYHISHFMQKMLGMSFQEYLSHLRFRHALILMQKTDLKLLDICLESGFSSTRYMNQMFERQFHCSAKEYRKSENKPFLSSLPVSTDTIQKKYDGKKALQLLQKYKKSHL